MSLRRALCAIPSLLALVACGDGSPPEPASDLRGEPIDAPPLAAVGEPGGATEGAPPAEPSGPLELGWERLASYEFRIEGPRPPIPVRHQVPDEILALDGVRARLEGHLLPQGMLPDGSLRSFILHRYYAACCFGANPMMNEWAEVEMLEPVTDVRIYQEIYVTGRLAVRDSVDEDGYAETIYRLEGESLEYK